MQIGWEEIKKEFPKSYKKFLNSLSIFEYIEYDIISLMKYTKGQNERPIQYENICYCDLEKFFDEKGIIIDIYPSPSFKLPWTFNIYDTKFETNIKINEILRYQFNSRQEAKEQSIYKAFEIMEGMSKDE